MGRRLFAVLKEFSARYKNSQETRIFKPSETVWANTDLEGTVTDFECDNIFFEVDAETFKASCLLKNR